jgi:hypothetical protein
MSNRRKSADPHVPPFTASEEHVIMSEQSTTARTYRTYIATVSTGDYLPYDGPAYFDTAHEAWTYLAEERDEALAALADLPPDLTVARLHSAARDARRRDDDDAQNLGTVRGTTPGYEGDHDQGATYSVDVYEGVICADCGARFADPDAGSLHWLAEHLERNTL